MGTWLPHPGGNGFWYAPIVVGPLVCALAVVFIVELWCWRPRLRRAIVVALVVGVAVAALVAWAT